MKKLLTRFMMLVGIAAALTFVGGCSQKERKIATGTAIGATAGTVIGLATKANPATVVGGAVGGGLLGGLFGSAS